MKQSENAYFLTWKTETQIFCISFILFLSDHQDLFPYIISQCLCDIFFSGTICICDMNAKIPLDTLVLQRKFSPITKAI